MTDKKEKLTHHACLDLAKSNHLGVVDLELRKEEGKPLIYTIREVKKEIRVVVAGKTGDHIIAYFVEKNTKPLVLNSTNRKRIRNFAPNRSAFIEHWKGILIELYVDENVKMKGEIVGGVRVKTRQPKAVAAKVKQRLSPISFKAALAAIEKGTLTKETLLADYFISEEQKKQLKDG